MGNDGKLRLCHICGKMRNRVYVDEKDLVLVSLRDYQDYKADIILKYRDDEVRKLKEEQELSDHIRLIVQNETNEESHNDLVYFGDNNEETEDYDSSSDFEFKITEF